jgi:hypothetical protein
LSRVRQSETLELRQVTNDFSRSCKWFLQAIDVLLDLSDNNPAHGAVYWRRDVYTVQNLSKHTSKMPHERTHARHLRTTSPTTLSPTLAYIQSTSNKLFECQALIDGLISTKATLELEEEAQCDLHTELHIDYASLVQALRNVLTNVNCRHRCMPAASRSDFKGIQGQGWWSIAIASSMAPFYNDQIWR